MQVKVTGSRNVSILGCPRCDTAMLPEGEWPRGGAALLSCPLCGCQEEVTLVEVGGEELIRFNPAEQREDAANTPLYQVESVVVDDDLVLITVAGLLKDPVFFALQSGVAPVDCFAWVGGERLLGSDRYRLILIVRVVDLEGDDIFRIEFPADQIAGLAHVTEDRTVVLVSGRKGVLFAEAGEVYLQAVADAGRKPGEEVALNEWAQVQE